MNTIEKLLSELPKADVANVQKRLHELVLNAAKKDRGEDLSKILAPYEQRFDKYMSEIVNCCSTSISIYNESTDEYFMISKESECVNLTKLVNDYRRLPISDWLVRFSIYFFDIDLELTDVVKWGFMPSEMTFNMVAMLYVESIKIAEQNGVNGLMAYQYFAEVSKTGQFESLNNFQINHNGKLNELHIMMADLNDVMLKYPIDAIGSPFNQYVILDLGFDLRIDLFGMYENIRTNYGADPLAAMVLLERSINDHWIHQLNYRIKDN